MADTVVSSITVSKAGGARSTDARERRFFLYMALITTLMIVLGFLPSFYLKDVIHAPPPLQAITWVHGVVFTVWMLLFVTQVTLIDRGSTALHRRLGLVGAVLLGVVLAVGVTTGINAGRLGHAPPGSGAPLVFMVVPIAGITATAVLFLAALWNRARRDAHMRYMLAAFVTMTPPATGRIFIGAGLANQSLPIAFGIMDGLLAIAILYDLNARKSLHPAYLWSAFVYVAVQGVIVWAYNSPAWLSAAHWLVQT